MLPHSGLIPSCDLCCKPFTSSKQSVREQESRLSRRRYLKAVSASGSKQAAQVLQLRKAKVVELRRGDLTWRQPPWHFDCTTTIDALQLDSLKEIDSEVRLVELLRCFNFEAVSASDYACALQAARQSQVAVQYTVSPTGAGYFVSGDADTDLPLQCDCCLSTFKQPVKAPFKVCITSIDPGQTNLPCCFSNLIAFESCHTESPACNIHAPQYQH